MARHPEFLDAAKSLPASLRQQVLKRWRKLGRAAAFHELKMLEAAAQRDALERSAVLTAKCISDEEAR